MSYVKRQPAKVLTEAHIQNLIWLRRLPLIDKGSEGALGRVRRADAAVNKYCRETGNKKTDPLDQIRAIQQFR